MDFRTALQAAGLRPRDIVPDGKWRRIYESLIAKRLDNAPSGYVEKHHIVPKALGGTDAAWNIVRLTAREHFVAHLLLARMFGGTMWLAVIRMKGRRVGNEHVNSRLYANAKENWAAWSSANQRGERHWAYGKPGKHKGEKRPQSSGDKHWAFGKPMKPEHAAALLAANKGAKRAESTKRKIAEAQRGEKNHLFGKSLSDEHRAKLSAAMKQRRLSDEHKRRIGEAHRGRAKSEETKRKLSEAAKRRYGTQS